MTPRTVFSHLLVAVLAMVVGLGWSFSSPVGSAPDDDFHLPSIWCPPPVETSGCAWQSGPNGAATSVMVPKAVAEAGLCFRFHSETSGQCTDLFGTELAPTSRFDAGLYPGMYYRIMHVFAGSHVERTVLLIRMVNVMIAVLMLVGLSLVASARLRPLIGLGVLSTVVPLGLFTIASTNPSSWAISGVAAAAVGLLVALDADTWPRRGVAAGIGVLGAVLAAMARTDSAVFLAIVLLSVAVLHLRKILRSPWIWPVLGLIALAGIWAALHGSQTTLNGFGSQSSLDRTQLLRQNALEVASIPVGVFGTWGLGWVDTPMPAAVYVSTLVAVVIVAAVGLSAMSWQKAVALSLPVLASVALPLYVLNKVGDYVGTQVQPRYVLPAVVVTLILLMLHPSTRRAVRPSMPQLVVVGALLALAQAVAIWAEIRRYTTGVDAFSVNLDNAVEWWWHMGPRPMLTVGITALAFAALLGAVLWQVHALKETVPSVVDPGAVSPTTHQVEAPLRQPTATDQIDRGAPAGES